MQITANSTILYCAHYQDSLRFYHELLELPVSFKKDDWFIELRISGFAHLSLADAARCTIAPSGGAGLTLSWCVAALEPLHHKLASAGVRITSITSGGWRLPYFYAYDPEGTRIEFWSMGGNEDQSL
ncbi:MAG: VOC family protein [Pseudomonadales bacterium]|jgi:catechol 2,3-dioxygenase-like lactoylglutathione lyase family enzyme|nr:VOC family protein [Pseudomonadales bacterium]